MSETGKAVESKWEYPPAYSYYVVILLLIAYIFSYLDRMILNLVLDPIRHELNLTEVEVSYLAGPAFALCYTIFAFPFGWYVDTRARRNVVVFGVAFWSLATICCGLANSFWRLFFSRMGVGIGEASINPAAYSMIPDYFPPEKRGFATAIFASGPAIGGGLAVLIGGLIVDWALRAHPVLPLLGTISSWKIAFLVVGAPGLIVALIVWLTVREPARRVSAKTAIDAPSVREVAKYMWAHGLMFFLVFAGYTAIVVNGYSFNVWGPAFFMRVHGLSPTEVGVVFGIAFGIFGTPGILLGGLLCDRWLARGKSDATVRVTLLCAIVQGPFFLAAYLTSDSFMAQVWFILALFFHCLYGGMQGAMVQALSPARMRGQIGAIYLIVANLIGLGFAPTFTAWMTQYVFGGPMGVGHSLAVTATLSLVLAIVLLVPSLKLVRVRAAALHGS